MSAYGHTYSIWGPALWVARPSQYKRVEGFKFPLFYLGMLLCFDVGNTQIHGGFYRNAHFEAHFRFPTKMGVSSDQLGVFLHQFCHIHDISPTAIEGVAISSVVPSIDYHLRNAIIKYFKREPFFVKSQVKTGLTMRFRSPGEVGADLICAAVGAMQRFPAQNVIIIDLGTATTVMALNTKGEFISGVIVPGLQTQAASLAQSAEKLVAVDLIKPLNWISENTTQAIQAGIYHLHLGGLKWIIQHLAKEAFLGEEYTRLSTGGLHRLFEEEDWVDAYDPDLVLQGLARIYDFNQDI